MPYGCATPLDTARILHNIADGILNFTRGIIQQLFAWMWNVFVTVEGPLTRFKLLLSSRCQIIIIYSPGKPVTQRSALRPAIWLRLIQFLDKYASIFFSTIALLKFFLDFFFKLGVAMFLWLLCCFFFFIIWTSSRFREQKERWSKIAVRSKIDSRIIIQRIFFRCEKTMYIFSIIEHNDTKFKKKKKKKSLIPRLSVFDGGGHPSMWSLSVIRKCRVSIFKFHLNFLAWSAKTFTYDFFFLFFLNCKFVSNLPIL